MQDIAQNPVTQVLDCTGLNGGPWSIWTDPPILVRIKLK
jgi:hypothetical protein